MYIYIYIDILYIHIVYCVYIYIYVYIFKTFYFDINRPMEKNGVYLLKSRKLALETVVSSGKVNKCRYKNNTIDSLISCLVRSSDGDFTLNSAFFNI